MAVDVATTHSQGIPNIASGSTTGAGAVVDVTLGFKPRYIEIFNETDLIVWKKYEAQAAANCLKQVAAGTITLDATSAVLIKGGIVPDTYRGFMMSAALAAAGKSLHWIAVG